MKKLSLFILATCFLFSLKVYAANPECSEDDTRIRVPQSSYDTTHDALVKAKTTLCGPKTPKQGMESYYNDSKNRCVAEFDHDARGNTPAGREGGLWGYFQQSCFSDVIPGSCFYEGEGGYYFIHGKVKNKEACRTFHLKKSKNCQKFSANAQQEPPTEDKCISIVCFRSDINDPKEGDRFEQRWVKKYGGWDNPVKSAKIKRHSSGGGWNSGSQQNANQNDDAAKDAAEDNDEDVITNGTLTEECQSMCAAYWKNIAAIPPAQAALDEVCVGTYCKDDPACVCKQDPKCDCETNSHGKWINNKCSCDGLTEEKRLICLCTTGTPAGIWSGGHCIPKTGGNLPDEYTKNNTSGGSISGTGSSEGSTTDGSSGSSASLSGSAAPAMAGLGMASGDSAGKGKVSSGSQGSTVASGSGKGWYAQLSGLLSTKNMSGGGAVSNMGDNGNPNNNMKPSQGFASSNEDLLAMVHKIHQDQYAAGRIAEPTDAGSIKKSTKHLGTKPVTYGN